MKKRYTLSILSMVLVLVSLCSFFVLPVSAGVEKVTSVQNKIDEVTLNKISNLKDNEKIKVWVWFRDIDESNIQKATETECGLTLEETREEKLSLTNNLTNFLNKEIADCSVEELAKGKQELSEYIKISSVNKSNNKFRIYSNTFRAVSKEMYEEHNTTLVKEVGLYNNAEIEFISTLSPSLIVSLSKADILELEKNENVVSIGYVDETEQEPPECENQIITMNVDDTIDTFGVSGDGVNVLMIDHDFVRSDLSNYSSISNTNKIKNVYKQKLYSTSNTGVLPTAQSDHANSVARVFQLYAESANIYSVFKNNYSDIEWAISNCDIDLINCSSNYATSLNYDSYSKWYDALIAKYDIPVFAAAGNSMTWNNGHNAPHVISPANAYNTIAVGAYSTNGVSSSDRMYDFRYSPTSSTNVVQNKPDLVVASTSTSHATPSLSGIAALILEVNPDLLGEPELMKAIFMASCHRKVLPASGTEDTQEDIFDGLTLKQGAGAVDAYRAMCIALLGNYGVRTISEGTIDVDAIQLTCNNNVNVSLVWSRENTMAAGTTPSGSVTLSTLQELGLSVYNGNTLVESSNKTNTGKQMVYFTGSKNLWYTIKVTKNTTNASSVTFAYAWSDKTPVELESVQISGNMAKGQTLTAIATRTDGATASTNSLKYQWKSSSNGQSWTNISGATASTYVLTNNELLKYIKCEVTPKEYVGIVPITISSETTIKVILYGDVNLNGAVSVADSTLIQKYLAHTATLTSEQLVAADVNGDGAVTTKDVTLIQMYVSNLIDSFPVEE